MPIEKVDLQIRKLDLLIHPGYGYPSANPIHEEELRERFDVWRKRISVVANDPGHYMAIRVPHALKRAGEGKELGLFLNFAKQKLGHRLLVVEDENIDTGEPAYFELAKRIHKLGFHPTKLRVNLYGERADQCVKSAVWFFVPKILPSERIKQSVKVLLHLSTLDSQIITPQVAKSRTDIAAKIREIMGFARKGRVG